MIIETTTLKNKDYIQQVGGWQIKREGLILVKPFIIIKQRKDFKNKGIFNCFKY